MATYVVRVWVPDRPGALGAVASRIGAVRGDLIGVDILERGAGRAIDELVVELPGSELLDLMINEVNEVDGVDVEDVREVPDAPVDPRLDALETAAYLVQRRDATELLRALVSHAARDLEADWAAVMDPAVPQPLASVGSAPPDAWVFAFVQGAPRRRHFQHRRRRRQPDRRRLGRHGGFLPGNNPRARRVAFPGTGTPPALRVSRIADHRWVELVTRLEAPKKEPSAPARPGDFRTARAVVREAACSRP